MTFDPDVGDGAQFMDIAQLQAALAGYSLVDPNTDCEVTPADAGGLAVDVSSGTARLGGPAESISAQSDVALPSADPDDPRKALVYLDDTGTVQTLGGDPAPAAPPNEEREKAAVPSVPIPASDYLPLASVWIPAGATSISSGDIRSRRTPFNISTITPLTAVNASGPTVELDRGALAIGVDGDTAANGNNAVAIGNGSTADGGVALGPDASSGAAAIAAGDGSSASANFSNAFGFGATANGFNSLSLGSASQADGSASAAIGRNAEAVNDDRGVLGVATSASGTSAWVVPGDFTVNGSKNFEIDHPSKPETHDLKHGAYEGPVAGGLIYSATVSVSGKSESLTGVLPGYVTNGDFGRDWTCHVTATDHFGRGYVDSDTWEVVVEEPGHYEVTIFGERDDKQALSNGGDRFEKPKGERWNGDLRTYYRDCPHVDADDYDGVERVEAKFDHGEDCDPIPCESAYESHRVTFSGGERVEVTDAMFDESADSIVAKARDNREA